MGGYVAIQIFENLPNAAPTPKNGYPGALATAVIPVEQDCPDPCWFTATFPTTVSLNFGSTYYFVVSVPTTLQSDDPNPIYDAVGGNDVTIPSSSCPSDALSSSGGVPNFSVELSGSGIAFAVYGAGMTGSE